MKNLSAPLLSAILLLCSSLASAAPPTASDDSLYLANVPLTTQQGKQATFDLYRGRPVLVSMFYGSCRTTCPLLISGLQGYEKMLDEAARANLRVLLISFDPQRDTPEALAKIAQEHHVDTSRWTLARVTDSDARTLATLLGIQYKRLPDGDFRHNTRIVLLDAQGHIAATTTRPLGDETFGTGLRRAMQPH